MEKKIYILWFSLGLSFNALAMEYNTNDVGNALKLLSKNYVNPSFISQNLSSKNYQQSVGTYLNYIKKNPLASNNFFQQNNPDIIQYLQMKALLSQNTIEKRERSHWWKTMRQGFYTGVGAFFAIHGINTLFDTNNLQNKASGNFVGSVFIGLGTIATILAARSGKNHWSQYQDTKQLKKEYTEHVINSLNNLKKVD